MAVLERVAQHVVIGVGTVLDASLREDEALFRVTVADEAHGVEVVAAVPVQADALDHRRRIAVKELARPFIAAFFIVIPADDLDDPGQPRALELGIEVVVDKARLFLGGEDAGIHVCTALGSFCGESRRTSTPRARYRRCNGRCPYAPVLRAELASVVALAVGLTRYLRVAATTAPSSPPLLPARRSARA